MHHNQMAFFQGLQASFNIWKSINIIHHINRLKDGNHMIISIAAGKAFGKMRNTCMIKTVERVGIEGT